RRASCPRYGGSDSTRQSRMRDCENVNQHIPAPDEINACCPDRELLDIALEEFNRRTALLVQSCTPKLRQNNVNSDSPAIEPSGQLKAVVTPATTDIGHCGTGGETCCSGYIEQRSP